MKIRSQITMVLSLDKCIGCHTCSVTCKNVWTSRKGMEYVWFNNVETKPGPGYPVKWEDQEKYKGGWVKKGNDSELKMGNRLKIMSSIFSNPYLPQMDDYYEPFSFDFSRLRDGKRLKTPPSARPYSLITGEKMEKIPYGPNWEDDLAGPFEQRKKDPNLKEMDTKGFEEFEKSFMYYLPRLCEHCLHPACVASCPSSAIYKREKDGIVLINQDKCRGWRECISACPYKKIYFNTERMKSEKCIFCYPLIENGKATVCGESCVGRLRYIGALLYDAEHIDEYAAADEKKLYEKQLSMILDPHDPEVIKQATAQGVSYNFIKAAQSSPVYKMMKEWKIAFPLHPEYRTLPMVWYIPPMSPIGNAMDINEDFFAKVDEMRIPLQYMARMFTNGEEAPVRTALARMLALRSYMRKKSVEKIATPEVPEELGLNADQFEEMYKYLAIANYEDRFVIPSVATQEDSSMDLFKLRAGLGFEHNEEKPNLFGGK